MRTRDEMIVALLKDNRGRWIRQREIADAIGISQQAVSKRIEAMREAGQVRRVWGKGYQLV